MIRKLLLILCAGLCLHVSAAEPNRAERLRERLVTGDTTSVLVIAHRGDWRYAPENSLAAIEHSIAVGADVVEVDLQMTRDSILILMHDATLNRTTTGKGPVADWSLDSIRTLQLKSGCGIATRQSIPTLEEAMTAVKGRVLINLDKADRYFDQVVRILEKTGTMSQIIMKGVRPADEVQRLYGQYLDRIIYMPVVWLDKPSAGELMKGFQQKLKPVAYEFVYNDDTNPLPKACKRELAGKSLIWYNTLEEKLCAGHDDERALTDPDGAFGYLIHTLGARMIQTDRAELLLKYLRSHDLHE